jgi:nitrogen fixation protein FixH
MQDELVKGGGGRPLTGRMVLFMLLGFFGVVIAVNLVMVRFATSTFSGVGEKNAYMAGVSYNKSLAAAREQDRRGWKVDASLQRVAPGRSVVTITRSDGGAFASVEVTARFLHPASGRMDRAVALAPSGPNEWRGAVDLPAGVWDIVIEMRSGGAIVFMSRDRVQASDAKSDGNG